MPGEMSLAGAIRCPYCLLLFGNKRCLPGPNTTGNHIKGILDPLLLNQSQLDALTGHSDACKANSDLASLKPGIWVL